MSRMADKFDELRYDGRGRKGMTELMDLARSIGPCLYTAEPGCTRWVTFRWEDGSKRELLAD